MGLNLLISACTPQASPPLDKHSCFIHYKHDCHKGLISPAAPLQGSRAVNSTDCTAKAFRAELDPQWRLVTPKSHGKLPPGDDQHDLLYPLPSEGARGEFEAAKEKLQDPSLPPCKGRLSTAA